MVKISEDRCKGSDDLSVWMGIVFSWRLRVYAMNLHKHWMDLLRDVLLADFLTGGRALGSSTRDKLPSG